MVMGIKKIEGPGRMLTIMVLPPGSSVDSKKPKYGEPTIFPFEVVDNSSGGDCLFKALAQARGATEANHFMERRRIITYATEIWEDVRQAIQGQHIGDPDMRAATLLQYDPENEQLQEQFFQEYTAVMGRLGCWGTETELGIASRHYNLGFNYMLIQSLDTDGFSFQCKSYPSESPNIQTWYYFMFSGNINGGHWELLRPKNTNRRNIPDGTYVEYGYSVNDENLFVVNSKVSSKAMEGLQRNCPMKKLKDCGRIPSNIPQRWVPNSRKRVVSRLKILDASQSRPPMEGLIAVKRSRLLSCTKVTKSKSARSKRSRIEKRDIPELLSSSPPIGTTTESSEPALSPGTTNSSELALSPGTTNNESSERTLRFTGSRVVIFGYDKDILTKAIAKHFIQQGAKVNVLVYGILHSSKTWSVDKIRVPFEIVDTENNQVLKAKLLKLETFQHVVIVNQYPCQTLSVEEIQGLKQRFFNIATNVAGYLNNRIVVDRTLVSVSQFPPASEAVSQDTLDMDEEEIRMFTSTTTQENIDIRFNSLLVPNVTKGGMSETLSANISNNVLELSSSLTQGYFGITETVFPGC